MRIGIILLLLISTSCRLRFVSSGYYTPQTTLVTQPVIIPPVNNFGFWSYRPYWWRPSPLGNVYNNYYYNPPRNIYNPPRNTYVPPRTNLPLNTGPRGGRRK
jgi:hypothetical protein